MPIIGYKTFQLSISFCGIDNWKVFLLKKRRAQEGFYMKQWYKIKVEDIIRGRRNQLARTQRTHRPQKSEKKQVKTPLRKIKKSARFQVFLGQFKDFLVIILIAAALISMFSDMWKARLLLFQ